MDKLFIVGVCLFFAFLLGFNLIDGLNEERLRYMEPCNITHYARANCKEVLNVVSSCQYLTSNFNRDVWTALIIAKCN